MKLKKRKKSGRFRGSRMHGRSAKKGKGKGNRGGKGMAGTGKKAGHKASYLNVHFDQYLGKQGFTSRSSQLDKLDRINIGEIQKKISSYIANGNAKKGKDGIELNLLSYKILGDGELKDKLVITAMAFSKQAREKIEKAGGKAVTLKKEE